MSLSEYLEATPKPLLLVVAFLLVPTLGLVEYVAGPYLAFPIFYLLPISVVSWFAGRRWGFAVCMVSAITMVASGLATGLHPQPVYVVWNSAIRTVVFLLMAYMLAELRVALINEKELARRDALTGIANRRMFMEVATAEIHRSQRYGHPFTLAYIDVDDFKAVNDASGHAAGDALLKELCVRIERDIRQADTLARMGGDEFAILFPQVNYEAAEVVARRIEKNLGEAFQVGGKPVTFSIGVVTFDMPPANLDEMVKSADELMYAVKAGGKNRLAHALVGNGARPAAIT